jgi:glycosyltransferase involved in cell wall biosynthesis
MSSQTQAKLAHRPIRIAYLVTHPIQYQAPLLRRIASNPAIDLQVFFRSDLSVDGYFDEQFRIQVKWDVPLLDGYNSTFLPAFGATNRLTRWRPFNHGLFPRLRQGEFDILWVHGYSIWFNLIALFQARLLGIRTFMRDDATLISRHRSGFRNALKKLFHWTLDRLVDRYLTNGSLNRDYYQAQGVRPEKLHMIGYAVDNDYFRDRAVKASGTREDLRQSLGLAPGRPIILYASKLTARKRADELLTAHATIHRERRLTPAPYLLIIGSGELEPVLRERVADEGIPDVHLLGFKNQSELPAYFDLCDVFVLPSQHEPWGLIINEVMNASKPVIVSSDVGCGPDLVQNGENGFIFPLGDVAALTEALVKVLVDPAVAASMGTASLEKVTSWNFDYNVTELIAACESLGLKPGPASHADD